MLVLPIGALLWLAPARRPVSRGAPPTALPAAIEPAPVAPAHVAAKAPVASAAPSAAPPDADDCEGLCGVVVDPGGRPVQGAIVACVERDRRDVSVTAGAGGRFVMPVAASGCAAYARAPGFADSDPVALDEGRPARLALGVAARIRGVVIGPGGQPAPSFWLKIDAFHRASGDGEIPVDGRARLVESREGAFAMEGLSPGSYVIAARVDGAPPTESRVVHLGRGEQVDGLRIEIASGIVVSGRVVDARTRERLAGASVALENLAALGPPPPPAATDAAGEFSLRGAPNGLFSLRVAHAGHRTRIVGGLDGRGPGARVDVALDPAGDGGATRDWVGVGVALAESARGVTVVGVVEGSPAARAGVREGDRVARIDGDDAADFSLVTCLQRLRGEEGSRVRLSLARDGAAPIDVALAREKLSD
jgi:hypothetical protein